MFWIFNKFRKPTTVDKVFVSAKKLDPNLTKNKFLKLHKILTKNNLLIPRGMIAQPKIIQPKHLGVWLHLTNQCNLRCTYCYIAKTSAKFDMNQIESTLTTIFRKAKEHGFTSIALKMSGGECLLELKSVILVTILGQELAKQYLLKFRPIVMTNGVLITERTAQLLKKYKIHAAISLDGLDQYHDKHRIFPSGLGSFKAVISGISELQKIGTSYNCLVAVTKDNEKNLPSLTRYFIKHNTNFAFNFFRENEISTDNSSSTQANDQTLILALKKSYCMIAKARPATSLLRYLLDRINLNNTHHSVCGRGSSYLVIGSNSQLYPCQMDIGHTPLSATLTSDPITTMQNWGAQHPHEIRIGCHSCPYYHYCTGGCPRLSSPAKNNPYCHIYQELIPYLLKLESKRLINQ